MAIDPYSPCPGGKDKKVKFCCPDLLGELEKIQRMVEGEQHHACLDYIAQLEQKFPDRACLLTTKAILQGELGDAEAAKQTAGKVLASQPDNPVALAETALLSIASDGARSAVEPLQRAIVAGKDRMAANVFEAIGVLAAALVSEGHWLAALAHGAMLLQIRSDHRAAGEIVASVSASPSVPLPLKDFRRPFDAGPVEPSLQQELDAAIDEADHFHWLAAAGRLAKLAERSPKSPAVWRNLGRLRAYLADEAGAAEAYRRCAKLDIPLDDAVEAEALAQLLGEEQDEERVELVFLEYPITDMEQLEQRLSGSRYAQRSAPEEAIWDDPDQPPPRATFWLLDRPMPASGVGLAIEDVPESLCQLFLFGRETDRAARLNLAVYRDQLAAAQARIGEIAGDSLGAAGAEQVIGATSRLHRAMNPDWRLPSDTSLEQMRKLSKERFRKAYFEVWPKTPIAAAGGQTPEAAAPDPTYRVSLLAAILLMELSSQDYSLDFNDLRSRLGLPLAAEIDLDGKQLDAIPLAYLHRLAFAKLSDEDLIRAYSEALMTGARRAAKRAALELVSRPGLDNAAKAQAYGVLASFAESFDEAIERVNQARTAAEAAGKSSAAWDLEELMLRLGHGDAPGAERVLKHVQSAHGNEPGVRQRLLQLLYQAGVIDEQGRPIRRAAEEPAGLVVPGGSTEQAGKLWTPGGETGEGKKSALWVPGMD